MSDYTFFIAAAYAVAGVTVSVIVIRIVRDYRRLREELARYGAAGERDEGREA